MKLHEHPEDFRDLITLTAREKHIPESAIARDYYIVYMLQKLEHREMADQCVFKGGTSLSKCYPGSIERFSEDIDLTFLGMELSDKACSRAIKKIEEIMTEGAHTQPIPSERSNRSKAMFVWYEREEDHIKLEIGSSVRPDPYQKRSFCTFIQEYLEKRGFQQEIEEYALVPVTLNVLDITRTFIDKLMSVKRHAVCGTLSTKARHIYDVVRLYQLPEIQTFLLDAGELKRLVALTKETDAYYLDKRGISARYDPKAPYDFRQWQQRFEALARDSYETLHEYLLFTDEPQDFALAARCFAEISDLLSGIGE